jgi:hypothetical protein
MRAEECGFGGCLTTRNHSSCFPNYAKAQSRQTCSRGAPTGGAFGGAGSGPCGSGSQVGHSGGYGNQRPAAPRPSCQLDWLGGCKSPTRQVSRDTASRKSAPTEKCRGGAPRGARGPRHGPLGGARLRSPGRGNPGQFGSAVCGPAPSRRSASPHGEQAAHSPGATGRGIE